MSNSVNENLQNTLRLSVVYWPHHFISIYFQLLLMNYIFFQDVTRFDLKNLQPNSLYFLQVQALAQFGKERLKGEKAALVLNTTNHTNGKYFKNKR